MGCEVTANLPIVLLLDETCALPELCGISLLERNLRILQRLGVTHATVLTNQPERLRAILAQPSWARAEISIGVETAATGDDDSLVLALCGDTYFDPRLLEALLRETRPIVLVDSAPPDMLRALLENRPRIACGYLCGAAVVSRGWLREADITGPKFLRQLAQSVEAGAASILDVETQPAYLVNLRRTLRPLWFPAPPAALQPTAERLLLDAAQNGTLDLPAKLHAPIETWIIARLCRTRVTPNQITLFTAAISAGVTALFFTGHLGVGLAGALAVGVLDGLDGKQARVKVETTPLGKREHVVDYVLELSWWTALAFHFASAHQLRGAYIFLALIVASDLLDRVAKRRVKQRTGRNLDDLAPIDRFVRLIGARRNIYIWLLTLGLLLRTPSEAFLLCGLWGAGTAAIHSWRAFQIARA